MNKNNKTNNGNENHGSHCQQMSDGTFDFVPRTKPKRRTENVVIAHAIMDEAQDAIDALLNEQLTK